MQSVVNTMIVILILCIEVGFRMFILSHDSDCLLYKYIASNWHFMIIYVVDIQGSLKRHPSLARKHTLNTYLNRTFSLSQYTQ